MSGERLYNPGSKSPNKYQNNYISEKKVDINILLNKVRSEQKKEKFENLIFVCLVATVVVVTGIIISL